VVTFLFRRLPSSSSSMRTYAIAYKILFFSSSSILKEKSSTFHDGESHARKLRR
jgi:hypothetical protein